MSSEQGGDVSAAATLYATARVVKVKGDEYLASEIEQAANEIVALERELAALRAKNEKLREAEAKAGGYECGLADGLRKAAEVCRQAGDTFGKCDHQTGAYVCQQKILSLIPEGADQREAQQVSNNPPNATADPQSASHQNPGEQAKDDAAVEIDAVSQGRCKPARPGPFMCEGGCSEHSGDVGHYHVSYKGHDWGYFTYCENAVAADRSTGHTVVSKEKHEAMLAERSK